MDVGIPVEVEGTFGEFYPGLVTGIVSRDLYRVRLLNSSNSKHVAEICTPPTSMRLPPDLIGFPFDPLQGQEVDVLMPCVPGSEVSDNDSSSSAVSDLSAWWPGRVKKVGGGFVIVELVHTFDNSTTLSSQNLPTIEVLNGRVNIPPPSSAEKTDVVEKHLLRPKSHQKNFSISHFHMHPIDIPDELDDYCKDPLNYQHFARRCGLPVLVCMAPDDLRPLTPVTNTGDDTFEKRARLLVISTDVATVKRAAVIDNTFIDMLRQKVLLLRQTEELSRQLEQTRVSQAEASFVEDVHVPEDLIPLAIGYQGSNIRGVSSIPGIISVKFNRPCTFRISGKSKEAIRQAKAMLDFRTETIPVPRSYVNLIVGSGQRHIQHLVDCLGLRDCKIGEMPSADMEQFVAFQLTGTSQAMRDARMFLEFHVASLRDLDQLRGVDPPPLITVPDNTCHENPPVAEPDSFGDTSASPKIRRQPNKNSHRTQHPTSAEGTLTNGNLTDSNSADLNREHPYKDVSGPPEQQANGHYRPNQRARQPRRQNMQSNNNAVMKQDMQPYNTSTRQPPENLKSRQSSVRSNYNGYGTAMPNGTAPRPFNRSGDRSSFR